MDDRITEFIIAIKTSLASIETKVDNIQITLQNDESRIQNLEKTDSSNDSTFKDDILKLLAKAILISVCGFATLAGAGSVIAKINGT